MPTTTLTVSGMTPAIVGAGLDFDVVRQTDGYPSTAARTAANPATRVIASTWNPGTDPAPFDAPVTRPNEAGNPVVGELPMLTDESIGSGMLFTLNAKGSVEGSEDEDITIKASVQPLKAAEAAQVAELTQGRQAYVLYTETRLYTASESTRADHIAILGKDYEVMNVEEWGNTALAHYKILVVANVPLVTGVSR